MEQEYEYNQISVPHDEEIMGRVFKKINEEKCQVVSSTVVGNFITGYETVMIIKCPIVT